MNDKRPDIVDQGEDPELPQGEDPAVPRARTRVKFCQIKGCDQPSEYYHARSKKRYCRRHYIQMVNEKARG
ncbi:hypothetical protein ES703_35390 [subsurface metagenome]